MAGVDLRMVAELMGRTSIRTTVTYAHFAGHITVPRLTGSFL